MHKSKKAARAVELVSDLFVATRLKIILRIDAFRDNTLVR